MSSPRESSYWNLDTEENEQQTDPRLEKKVWRSESTGRALPSREPGGSRGHAIQLTRVSCQVSGQSAYYSERSRRYEQSERREDIVTKQIRKGTGGQVAACDVSSVQKQSRRRGNATKISVQVCYMSDRVSIQQNNPT
jgi:hypothetical protein